MNSDFNKPIHAFFFHIQFFSANLVGGGVPGEAGNSSINSNIKYANRNSRQHISVALQSIRSHTDLHFIALHV